MKKIFLIIILMYPFIMNAQAHLGSSFADLKSRYPEKKFKIEYTNAGRKYTTAEQPYGTFIYYFDNETNMTDFCIQIPNNMTALNAQVEAYNKKYVIVSETTWKAYLEGGGIMNITLTYDEENKVYVFYYTN